MCESDLQPLRISVLERMDVSLQITSIARCLKMFVFLIRNSLYRSSSFNHHHLNSFHYYFVHCLKLNNFTREECDCRWNREMAWGKDFVLLFVCKFSILPILKFIRQIILFATKLWILLYFVIIIHTIHSRTHKQREILKTIDW